MAEDMASQINATLLDMMKRIDALKVDVEAERGDGKLVIEFTDGSKVILSRQSATGQIWLAEPGGGWHYDWRDGQWRCSKRGITLDATVASLMSAKLGEEITLSV